MSDRELPPSKSQPSLPFEELALKEAEHFLQVYRNDHERVIKAMEARKKQIEALINDQKADERSRIKVEGALVPLQHLVTIYRTKFAQSKQLKRNQSKQNRRKRNRKNGKNSNNGKTSQG